MLKDWLDHFHLRSGGGGKGADSGSTDEITFYCSPFECRLKSFNEAAVGGIDGAFRSSSRPFLAFPPRFLSPNIPF